MGNRNLPDEKLHDLLHKLAELQKALNDVLTEIYIRIETKEVDNKEDNELLKR